MINWIGILQETLMITSFVIIMMLLIEFVNVVSRGSLVKLLNKNSFLQIIAGSLLGIIPGCMGTFAVVSLYSQQLLGFGALVATMIASSGDEAFFMLALMPKEAVILFVILFIVAVGAGVLVDKIFKNKNFLKGANTVLVEDEHSHDCDAKLTKVFSFKNFNFNRYRMYLSIIIIGIIILAFTGWIGHSHSDSETSILGISSYNATEHVHNDDCEHNHDHEHIHEHDHSAHVHSHGEFDLVKFIIIVCAILVFIIILFCDDHFIKEHLWGHVIKKHLPKIFLWVLGTLFVINLIMTFADLHNIINRNLYVVLLISLLIGIIPQSGPHLVFVILFMQGTIPFSILLANSIVQDGHGALPLLAESRKSFLLMKGISILVGLVFGTIGLLLGF